jgi:hypothetical protein
MRSNLPGYVVHSAARIASLSRTQKGLGMPITPKSNPNLGVENHAQTHSDQDHCSPDCPQEVDRLDRLVFEFTDRLRRLFAYEIGRDPRAFKKRIPRLIRREIPPRRGPSAIISHDQRNRSAVLRLNATTLLFRSTLIRWRRARISNCKAPDSRLIGCSCIGVSRDIC